MIALQPGNALKTDVSPSVRLNSNKIANNEYVNSTRSNRKVAWVLHDKIVSNSNEAYKIPPSMKGWVWCEDIDESATDTGDIHGYCTGSLHGNTKSKPNSSFGKVGDEAFKTWFRNPNGQLHYLNPTRATENNDVVNLPTSKRPMANALILKNDEAGIDGIELYCSNHNDHSDIPNSRLVVGSHSGNVGTESASKTWKDEADCFAFAKTMEAAYYGQQGGKCYTYGAGSTNTCGEECYETELQCDDNERLCETEEITTEGTGLDANEELVTVKMVTEIARTPMTKCSDGELTAAQCQSHCNEGKCTFVNDNDSTLPNGCYVADDGRVHYNRNGDPDRLAYKVCPRYEREVDPNSRSGRPFCCTKKTLLDSPLLESRTFFNTNSNRNENMHYEFMCVNDAGDDAKYLCDPETDKIVDFKGKSAYNRPKNMFGEDAYNGNREYCSDMNRKCKYVPIDAMRYGFDVLKNINPEKQERFNEGKVLSDNVGNNATVKKHTVSCARRGGVCGIAAKVHEVEAKHGMSKDGTWGGKTGGSMQYWFESAKKHNLFTQNTLKYRESGGGDVGFLMGGSIMQSVHRPEYGNQRQDGQWISNVQVMCCDGHTELAVKGDNDPYESQLANVTYSLSKEDLQHLVGGTEGHLATGCGRMGGEWTGSECIKIPNDNPTGSWEQVNVLTGKGDNFDGMLEEGELLPQ